MRSRLRATPAWVIALAFVSAVAPIRALLEPGPRSVAGVVLFGVLAAVLAARSSGNGHSWGIYGVLVAASLALKVVTWPWEVEVTVFALGASFLAWLLFDRDTSEAAPATKTASPHR